MPDSVYLSIDVDQQPAPKKGLGEVYRQFFKYFQYPAEARRYGVQGTVSVSFVVDKEGWMTDAQVVEGIGYGSEEAVLKAFQQIKVNWVPGQKDNEKVNVQMILPFPLKLG